MKISNLRQESHLYITSIFAIAIFHYLKPSFCSLKSKKLLQLHSYRQTPRRQRALALSTRERQIQEMIIGFAPTHRESLNDCCDLVATNGGRFVAVLHHGAGRPPDDVARSDAIPPLPRPSPDGGRFFSNHINFHHSYYSDEHLVSNQSSSREGNNTPFFLIPSLLVIGLGYWILPLDLLIAQVVAMSISFYAHVYLDQQYHNAASWLERYSWFTRKQQLHFAHHTDGNYNFAVMHNFWDRLFGTYRAA